MPPKKVFTLSKVTQSIANVIDSYSKAVWVKAEIVKLNHYKKSGHCYPDLVEKKDGKVIASMRGNIWKSHYQKINEKFKAVLNEELGDDMAVVFFARVKFHPVYSIALNITDVDPSYTLGELAKNKAETIKKLKDENVFTANKQTTLPILPKTLAIISVSTSKGYNDFLNVINNNDWNYQYHHLLFSAILQGENAVATITEQLEMIEEHKEVFDAVAIIRGGGGDIGLSCYDDYFLSKKIATFPIPVLTGIGHSTNQTISEMVSYKSFITPTKIAEYLLQQYHNFSVPLKNNTDKINNYAAQLLKEQKSGLENTARLFSSMTKRIFDKHKSTINQDIHLITNTCQQFLKDNKAALKNNAATLQYHTSSFIQSQGSKLDQAINTLGKSKGHLIKTEARNLRDLQEDLITNYKNIHQKTQQNITFTEKRLKLLDPSHVLQRGFSITRASGKVLRGIENLKEGQTIETELYQGIVESRVKKTKTKNAKK